MLCSCQSLQPIDHDNNPDTPPIVIQPDPVETGEAIGGLASLIGTLVLGPFGAPIGLAVGALSTILIKRHQDGEKS
jgi:hypothetical protein